MALLDSSEIARYQDEGFVIPRTPLPPHWTERLHRAFEHLTTHHPEFGLDYVPSPHVPFHVPGLANCEEWLALGTIPEVLDVVEQLLGPDLVLWGSALFGKPPQSGKATPWHQDGEYWPIRPLASCTVWIALDRCTPENGCLQVLPGSHRDRQLYHHRRDDDRALTLNQVIDDERCAGMSPADIRLEPGQFSVHDVYMVHGSGPNHSAHRRAAMTYRYMPASAHFDHEWAAEMTRTMGINDMSERPLFLVRGKDTNGRNDFRRGKATYGIAAIEADPFYRPD